MVRVYLANCRRQYSAVWCIQMTKRLTARAWIDFALAALAHGGVEALKADVLARKLGVSRGSFYWHFSDLGAFHAKVIERWREATTEAIIADLEHYGSAEQRLTALLRRAFAHNAVLEVHMRTWAETNAAATRALSEVDHRRRQYIERMLVEVGIAPPLAATRAQLLYWTYLGAALSRSKLTGGRLERIVSELKRIGLGVTEKSATVSQRVRRRQRRR
jgi:AcrR family transcriptional regulator